MEYFAGVAIVATNLRQNLDESFLRPPAEYEVVPVTLWSVQCPVPRADADQGSTAQP
jgi:hypothetical protein